MSELPRWTEARVCAPLGWLELVAEVLSEAAPGGVAFGRPSLAAQEPPPGWDLVRAFLPEPGDTPAVRAAIERGIGGLARRTGAEELAGLRVEFRAVPPEDWARSWRRTWKPFRVGRICVLPPGDDRSLRPGDLVLRLEPGGAFGTGRHVTTRECLRVLQERVRPGDRLLDAGSGSGILAVAGVLLGAGSATGFDVDPLALPFALALARENRVEDRCEFRTGGFEVLDAEPRPFDAIAANLYADVLEAGLGRLARALRPGGWFVLSGCTEPRAAALTEAIARSPLRVDELRIRGRWHTFAGSLPESGPG